VQVSGVVPAGAGKTNWCGMLYVCCSVDSLAGVLYWCGWHMVCVVVQQTEVVKVLVLVCKSTGSCLQVQLRLACVVYVVCLLLCQMFSCCCWCGWHLT
jgi:hypothetical protein